MSQEPGIQLPNWLPEPLRADPRKTLLMSGLLLVLAVMLFRTFGGSATSSAVASTADDVADAPASVSGRTGKESASRATSLTRVWLKQPIKTVSRNLFAMRSDQFPTSGKAKTLSPDNGNISNFWTQLEKSRSEQADQKRRREVRIENLQRTAGAIKLQSIMSGSDPSIMVAGKILRVGETIVVSTEDADVDFKVLRIEAQKVLVESQGIRLELQMKR